jgi:drug/metabolite transporter (DMT)-like permease
VGGFALSFLIYNKVISAVNVGWAAIVLNLIPAFGLLSSMVFLGEEPTRSGISGACLIGGSVLYFTSGTYGAGSARGALGVSLPAFRRGSVRCANGIDGASMSLPRHSCRLPGTGEGRGR